MTVLDLLALLLGIWIGRRLRVAPDLWHARNELRIAQGRADHLAYLLEISRAQQAEHLAVCPLHQSHGDAA